MHTDFHLIDLVSQARKVQLLLRGASTEKKIEWLAARGSLEPIPKMQRFPQTYWFESPLNIRCAFFFDGDEFVFLGYHTTFTVTNLEEHD
jgi:hypothetical protein